MCATITSILVGTEATTLLACSPLLSLHTIGRDGIEGELTFPPRAGNCLLHV
jgi:hypothetical protein